MMVYLRRKGQSASLFIVVRTIGSTNSVGERTLVNKGNFLSKTI